MRSTSLMIRRGSSAIVPVDGAKYQRYQMHRECLLQNFLFGVDECGSCSG